MKVKPGAQSSPYFTALAQLEVFGLLLYRPILFLRPLWVLILSEKTGWGLPGNSCIDCGAASGGGYTLLKPPGAHCVGKMQHEEAADRGLLGRVFRTSCFLTTVIHPPAVEVALVVRNRGIKGRSHVTFTATEGTLTRLMANVSLWICSLFRHSGLPPDASWLFRPWLGLWTGLRNVVRMVKINWLWLSQWRNQRSGWFQSKYILYCVNIETECCVVIFFKPSRLSVHDKWL